VVMDLNDSASLYFVLPSKFAPEKHADGGNGKQRYSCEEQVRSSFQNIDFEYYISRLVPCSELQNTSIPGNHSVDSVLLIRNTLKP